MKKGKKKVGKAKNTVQPPVKVEEALSLVERVRRETEEVTSGSSKGGKGRKRVIARMAFALWLTTPVRYRGAPEAVLSTLGIADPDVLELMRVRTQKDFGEMFGVAHQAMCDWRKEIEEGEAGQDTRAFFRGLMREELAALYRKLIETGNAEEFKAFAGYVEGWMPGLNLQHSGTVETLLSDEEKKALDDLLRKNTKVMN